eukprot:5775532-Amphidinium_carterae.2
MTGELAPSPVDKKVMEKQYPKERAMFWRSADKTLLLELTPLKTARWIQVCLPADGCYLLRDGNNVHFP